MAQRRVLNAIAEAAWFNLGSTSVCPLDPRLASFEADVGCRRHRREQQQWSLGLLGFYWTVLTSVGGS